MQHLNSLANELIDEVFSHCTTSELKQFRLVSRKYASLLEPRVFSSLVIDTGNTNNLGVSLIEELAARSTRAGQFAKRLTLRLVRPSFWAIRTPRGYTPEEYSNAICERVERNIFSALSSLQQVKALKWMISNSAARLNSLDRSIIEWVNSSKLITDVSLDIVYDMVTQPVEFQHLRYHHLSMTTPWVPFNIEMVFRMLASQSSRLRTLELKDRWSSGLQFRRCVPANFNADLTTIDPLVFSALTALRMEYIPTWLYPILEVGHVLIRHLEVSTIDESLIRYLNSYACLQTLSIHDSHWQPQLSADPIEFYRDTLMRHVDTLKELSISVPAYSGWGFGESNAPFYAQYRNLSHLSIGLEHVGLDKMPKYTVGQSVDPSSLTEIIIQSLLLTTVTSLPLLIDLQIRCEDLNEFGNDIPPIEDYIHLIHLTIMTFDDPSALHRYNPQLHIQVQNAECFVLCWRWGRYGFFQPFNAEGTAYGVLVRHEPNSSRGRRWWGRGYRWFRPPDFRIERMRRRLVGRSIFRTKEGLLPEIIPWIQLGFNK